MIIDEAAFIRDMEKHWNAYFPTIACGGRCIAVSTTNGVNNWFEKTHNNAKQGKNSFAISDINYMDHPDYINPEWVANMIDCLGVKRFKQEILGLFVAPDSKETINKEEHNKNVVVHEHYHFHGICQNCGCSTSPTKKT